jgi:2-keto-4-pentenoate hydratase/2-oxohepta-3-ene-1,7-dioic acid hydratase in catechol pathway
VLVGRFEENGATRLCLRLDPEHLLDITDLADELGPAADVCTAFIAAGDRGAELALRRLNEPAAAAVRNIADVRMLAPLTPPRMRNFSVYEGHIRNAFEAGIEMRAGAFVGRAVRASHLVRPPRGWYRRPAYYKGNHLSVIGPQDDIVAPSYTNQLDYELELAVVVGLPGRDIQPDEALNHVFGYTILNDVSARDVLAGELFSGLGPAKGKDFDSGNVLGPWIATRDEIADPRQLHGWVKVNGQVRAECTTADMHHGVEAIVAEASRGETLATGEVMGTGCCTWGSGMEKMTFLAAGDLVEMSLGSLGVQRNRVAG